MSQWAEGKSQYARFERKELLTASFASRPVCSKSPELRRSAAGSRPHSLTIDPYRNRKRLTALRLVRRFTGHRLVAGRRSVRLGRIGRLAGLRFSGDRVRRHFHLLLESMPSHAARHLSTEAPRAVYTAATCASLNLSIVFGASSTTNHRLPPPSQRDRSRRSGEPCAAAFARRTTAEQEDLARKRSSAGFGQDVRVMKKFRPVTDSSTENVGRGAKATGSTLLADTRHFSSVSIHAPNRNANRFLKALYRNWNTEPG